MNIVLLCNEYPAVRPHAGIGTVVQILARGLQQRGHDITVVGLGESKNEASDQGVRVITLECQNTRYVGNVLSRLRLRRWLANFTKAHHTDLIEVPDSQGLLPLGAHDCPVIVRLHLSFTAVTHTTGEQHGRGLALYETRNLAANRKWIGVSQYVLDLTKKTFGISPVKSTVIYNPALPIPSTLPDVAGLPDDFILYVGHVSSRKGADILATAARQPMERRPDLHLVYVGGIYDKDGKPISEYIRATLGPALSQRVHFLGRIDREHALACMQKARVFVFPTWVEGFPMVILEAMSCGLPVIYSQAPAGRELIEDGVSGLLIDPASPAGITERIEQVLDDPSLARQLGNSARKRVAECFSLERFLNETERFYEACLNRPLDIASSPAAGQPVACR